MNQLMSIEFLINTSAKNRDKIQRTVDIAAEFAKKYLRAQGVEVETMILGQRALTKEERIRLVPSRVHYSNDLTLHAYCGRTRARKLSKDWSKVNCKFCRKLQPESAQRSLL